MDAFDYLEYHLRRMNESYKKMEADFEKLYVNSSVSVPKVGDRVVVAVGLIGRGFNWARKEAQVLEVGESSIKVGLKNSKDEIKEGYGYILP